MSEFTALRDEFCKDFEKMFIREGITGWNFYTNSTPENLQEYEKVQDEYSNLFKDENAYNNFKKIDKNSLSKHEQKQLKDLLKEFDEELNTGKEMKELRQKENEIAQKFNSYIYKIDGKEISKADLFKITQTEQNPEVRKKAYDAKIAGANLIADDMKEFVRMRNKFAKTKGYDNFFEYKLKEDYEVDVEFLDKLINEVYSNCADKIKEIQTKRQNKLKEFFKVDKLENYHYGLLLDSDAEKGVNEILERISQAAPPVEKGVNEVLERMSQAAPPVDIVKISKKMYKNMGYDIEKLEKEGKITMDLFPRKGKNTHGFCFGIEAGKDSRILANLTNNASSLDTLNHETGHCVYDLGIDTNLTFMDRKPASMALTEAIAMMMGDIIKREDVLKDILPEDLLKRFKKSLVEDEVSFVTKSLLIIDFERDFYKNPEQDPADLWNTLRGKYLNRFEEADNEWASIPHYLSHPAYYQNYFRANLMKVQIYNYLKSKLGNITENPETAEFMDKNIFFTGASMDEYELIRNLTGKDFSAEDFIKSIS